MSRAAVCEGRLWAIDERGQLRHYVGGSWRLAAPAITCVACHERHLYAATAAGSVLLFEGGGRQVKTVDVSTERITAMCIAGAKGDAQALFVGLGDGSLVRLALGGLELVAELDDSGGRGHAQRVEALATMDEFLFSGGADAAIFVWNVADNSCVTEIVVGAQPVTALATNRRKLWMGEADGTVRILDVYGDDAEADDGVCTVGCAKAHDAPVRSILPAANTVLTAAGQCDQLVRWDAARCAPLRTDNAVAAGAGILAVLVRHRELVEKTRVSVLDHKLRATDITLEAQADEQPSNVPNYDNAVMAAMQSEIRRLREQVRTYQKSAEQDHVRRLSFSNGDPNNLDPHCGNTQLRPQGRSASVGELAVALAEAKDVLTNALDRSVVEPDDSSFMGGVDSVAAEAVVKALRSLSVASNMAGCIERGSISDSEAPAPLRKTAAEVLYAEEAEDKLAVVRAERDALRDDVDSLNKSNATHLEVIDMWKSRCQTLESKLEAAHDEALEAEVTKRRYDELQCLTRHQVENLARTVETMEPRLNSHVLDAYNHMTNDRDALRRLQEENLRLTNLLAEEQLKSAQAREEAERRQKAAEELQALGDERLDALHDLRRAATQHDEEHELITAASHKFADAAGAAAKELDDVRAELHTVRAERDDVRSKIDVVSLERDEALAEVDALRADRDAAQAASATAAAAEDADTVALMRKLEESNQALNAELKGVRFDATKKARAAQSERAALAADLDEARQQVAKLTEAADADALSVRQLRARIEQKDAELAAAAAAATTSSPARAPPQPHTAVRSTWGIVGTRNDSELREALEAAAESTRCTQEVVKELTATAEAYKRAARCHSHTQATVLAVLRRVRALAKRKALTGDHLRPIGDALAQAVYVVPDSQTLPAAT